MKIQITITNQEARDIAHIKLQRKARLFAGRDIPMSEAQVNIEPPVELTSAHSSACLEYNKIYLIKMVRTAQPLMGLADAKAFVERYLQDPVTTPCWTKPTS